MKSADDIFRAELDKRNIEYNVTAEELYVLLINDQTIAVSLENIRRNYERDSDVDPIVQFVEKVCSDYFADTPSWIDVQPYVRYSLEPSDYETGFDDIIFNVITNKLNQVFVYVTADGSRITWINQSMLDVWGVSREQVVNQAEKNMTKIIADTNLETMDIDGNLIGMISIEETPFKASLILSPSFKDLVSPSHGWPVNAVVPCRDFAFIIRQDNREFLGNLAGTVIKEYRNSGHPITKDILEISDDWIRTIGTYPEPN